MLEIMEKNIKNEIEIEMSDNLRTATKKITGYHQIAKNSIFAISLILAHIAEYPKEFLENSNFSTIADYAETMFSYKKAYTYKLIKISKFISLTDINGDKLAVGDLIHDKIETDYRLEVKKDSDGFEYSPSQMLELIPLTEKQFEDNIIKLDSVLTCKELRSMVKDIISPLIEATSSDSTDSSEESKEEEVKFTDKERVFQMLEITSSLENEDVKQKIISVFKKAIKILDKAPETPETPEN